MDSLRQNKVNSLLLKEMATIMQTEGRRLLPGGLITVTGVRVSPDLGIAKVYVSLFPVKDKATVLERVRAGMAREISRPLNADAATLSASSTILVMVTLSRAWMRLFIPLGEVDFFLAIVFLVAWASRP